MMPCGIWLGWAIGRDLLARLLVSPVVLTGVRGVSITGLISMPVLRAWMHEFAQAHRRWGHRRAWKCARGVGYGVCRETLRKIWAEEGLRVLPRKKRKRLAGGNHREILAGQYPGDV